MKTERSLSLPIVPVQWVQIYFWTLSPCAILTNYDKVLSIDEEYKNLRGSQGWAQGGDGWCLIFGKTIFPLLFFRSEREFFLVVYFYFIFIFSRIKAGRYAGEERPGVSTLHILQKLMRKRKHLPTNKTSFLSELSPFVFFFQFGVFGLRRWGCLMD